MCATYNNNAFYIDFGSVLRGTKYCLRITSHLPGENLCSEYALLKLRLVASRHKMAAKFFPFNPALYSAYFEMQHRPHHIKYA